jgi:aspartate aminotransferase
VTRVSQAEQRLYEAKHDKEYLPIHGNQQFVNEAAKLAYGADSKELKEGSVS